MAAAPEPSTWAMLVVGFADLSLLRAPADRAPRARPWLTRRRLNGGKARPLTAFLGWLLTLQAQLQEKKIKPVLNRTVVALQLLSLLAF